jgi:hypothetical protein
MSQITKKFITNNAVADEKIRLDNNGSLRARNAANSADIDLLKVNTSDEFVLQSGLHPETDGGVDLGSPTLEFGEVHARYIATDGTELLLEATTGAINISPTTEVVILDQSATIAIPVKFYDAGNNFTAGIRAPATLTASYQLTLPPDAGTNGDVLSVDGSGNLSFVAPGGGGVTWSKETFTLVSGDITNQFLTVANTPIPDSLTFSVRGAGFLSEGGANPDWSQSGTQINFLNDLATGGSAALVAGDIVVIQYQY